MYLLDTDHISVTQQPALPEYLRLVQRMARHPRKAFFFSTVSLHEQMLGANAFINNAHTAKAVVRGYGMFQRILDDFGRAQVLPFDMTAAAAFDTLRAGRVRIATMDLRIAAIALSRGFTVLTRNLRDFQKVPGLAVEDWTT